MSPWWQGFVAGLLLLPGGVLVILAAYGFLRGPDWTEQWCVDGCPASWRASDHPWWPWWAWKIQSKAHNVRKGHGPQIRAWRVEHGFKPHWWSRRKAL